MIYIQTCHNCGTKFQTSKKNQKYCSEKCRQYFRKKINIIVVPKRLPKIEVPDFGRKTPPKHRNLPHIIDDTKKTIKKIRKGRKK